MMSQVCPPSVVMKGQRAAEKLAYFLFGRFVVEFDWLSQPNGFEYEKSVLRRFDKICASRGILNVFDINQDGGKSIMTQNYVIGCVELCVELVREYWMNRSKVINMNVCPTLTCWWR